MQKFLLSTCISRAVGVCLPMALVAASCSLEEGETLSGGLEVKLNASLSQPLSRTAVSSDFAAGTAATIAWEPSDAIGVFGSAVVNVRLENSASEPSATALFTGVLPCEDRLIYAYSPFVDGAADPTAVPVEICGIQSCQGPATIAQNDIKRGVVTYSASDTGASASFSSVAAMLRIHIHGLGSVGGLDEGESLRSLTLNAPSSRALTGSFTLDLTDGSLSSVESSVSPSLTLSFPAPDGSAVGEICGYAIVAPALMQNDVLELSVGTTSHIITLSRVAAVSLEPGVCYDLDLDLDALGKAGLLSVSQLEKVTTFSSFGFDVSANEGKILSRKLSYDGSGTVCGTQSSVQLEIDANGDVSGCIPYLYDFRLVPSFTLAGGEGYDVYVDGQIQESGVSEQDFSSPVSYVVVDRSSGRSSTFTVEVRGSGLPVMVIDTRSSYPSTTPFLDLEVPTKDSVFGEQDEIALYKDGVAVIPKTLGGYRLRGNITQSYPKKPFALKFASKTAVLGMPKHKRWCLLANWKDNTNLRNDLTQMIARQFTGRWTPKGEFVELVLDGTHLGLYYLCEQIKIDKNRLNIQDCYEDRRDDYASDPAAFPEPAFENCGYLMEFDNYFDENYRFRINGDQYLPLNCKDDFDGSETGQAIYSQLVQRMEAIDDYIDAGNFTAAYGLLDITDAAEYMLVMELVMNNEYKHPRSVYAYMDGGNDKLHFGPFWDFDTWTYPVIDNMRYYNSESYVHSYTSFQFHTEVLNTMTNYVWFKQLVSDPVFASELKARWAALVADPALQPEAVDAYIDSRVAEIAVSVEHDREMWPHPSAELFDEYMNADETTGPQGTGDMRSFAETIALLKQAYASRFSGLATAVAALP
ncbi:MAG: CotH kinase family protein [Bacteroidales bacterium]|nr:CotH kinase family protein [Bacteroidales bacterium]